jgi:Gluconolactonase
MASKLHRITLLSLAAWACIVAAPAFAEPPQEPPVPYNSYNYGVWDESVPAMPLYAPEMSISGWDLGVGALKGPKDLCVDDKGNVYVLDTGNKRVLALDKDLKLLYSLSSFAFGETKIELADPEGLCLGPDGLLYIADRGAKTVIVADYSGRVLRRITKPKSDLIDKSMDFLPNKILVDRSGVLYVLSFGSYEGAYTFDREGGFLGFFGSNKVAVSSKLRSDRFWRLFATKEQRSRMYRYVPVEYANFGLDRDGFIYTVSNFGDDEQRGQVRKLNPLSQNILFAGRKPNLMFFGDWETTYTNRIEKSSLVAVDVDDSGFISVLDSERGRVFQYDQSCNLIAIFGGPGDQVGAFRHAADLVSSGGRILVLDDTKGTLTAFEPTRYGAAIRSGTALYEDGKYQEALAYWFEALKIDRTNYLVLRGIGRAYERMGRYDEAMRYFKNAEFHGSYSDAFREWRTAFLRKNFAFFALAILLLLASPYIVGAIRKRKRSEANDEERVHFTTKAQFPFYLIIHPFKGWDELKAERQGSLAGANLILAAWFLVSVAEYQLTGFPFNFNRLDQMNLAITFASTIGIFFLWSVANWGVSTLQDGKGTFKEIWIFSAYSRMTTVLGVLPLVLLSNVLAQDEGFFLQLGSWIVDGWTWVQLLLAVRAVHRYELKGAIVSMLLSILGIVLIIVVGALFVSLFSQVFGFASTIFQEILLRI